MQLNEREKKKNEEEDRNTVPNEQWSAYIQRTSFGSSFGFRNRVTCISNVDAPEMHARSTFDLIYMTILDATHCAML